MRCFFTLLTLFTLVVPCWAEEIAIVKKIEGTVKIERCDEVVLLKSGDRLQPGDILITEDNSQVGVIFHDGSVLSLKENSILRISAFEFKPIEKKFNFKLKLKKGTTLFESGKIGVLSPESFSLEVPEGSIGIRGTKFLVESR